MYIKYEVKIVGVYRIDLCNTYHILYNTVHPRKVFKIVFDFIFKQRR